MMYNNSGNVSTHLPSSSNATTPRNPSISYPLLHQHQVHHPIMIPLPPSPSLPPFSAAGGSGGGGADDDDDEFPRRDERFPQWSNQETRDLIENRAQIEWDFTASKRSKNLWEMVANRMRDKGYRRTTDQCKCKWKNLVSRYKGQGASDVDNGRLCPFFDELHAVFTARDNRMKQAQLDLETGMARTNTMQPGQLEVETSMMKGKKKLYNVSADHSREDISEEQDDEEEIEVDHAGKGRLLPKRKAAREKRQKVAEKETNPIPSLTNANKNVLNSLQEIMRNFIVQQQRIDMQWRESMEKHAEEREQFEQEWRERMEKLERERLMMEQAWREREEQRRLREESRAEKRDALLTTLLNKLIRDESP
ncbi:Transcription factor GT-2 [Handroanthus impetiginosus]|uniref:Transcription factor GT-2 n=1 Tax=Handroanthus impetiginosus TaxID=429701 RepID=A0A2G9H9F7_9LAMI|nr:Transcription factor GT-2 [Handroanthus impetiginosus]